MYQVFVRGIEFYGYHGVSDEEQKIGHRFVVDVEAAVSGNAPENDDVDSTLDYGSVALRVIEIGTGPASRTVEKLAQTLADAILDLSPLVREVEVEVNKLMPPVAGVVESAGVRLKVSR